MNKFLIVLILNIGILSTAQAVESTTTIQDLPQVPSEFIGDFVLDKENSTSNCQIPGVESFRLREKQSILQNNIVYGRVCAHQRAGNLTIEGIGNEYPDRTFNFYYFGLFSTQAQKVSCHDDYNSYKVDMNFDGKQFTTVVSRREEFTGTINPFKRLLFNTLIRAKLRLNDDGSLSFKFWNGNHRHFIESASCRLVRK